jgi:starch phosphorylase
MEYLERNDRLLRVVNTLIDGTFNDGGTGMFRELYTALTEGAPWHGPDQYFLLYDFSSYCDARMRINRDYRDEENFDRKRLMNIAGAGYFSSDRTIREYADEIWNV